MGLYRQWETFLNLLNQNRTMPKKRKENKRKLRKRLFILCEGGKTEPYYFKDLIRDIRFPGSLASVKIVETTKNTPRELVKQARQIKKNKNEFTNGDQVWVVFDRDGYTKHPESFNTAKDNGIEIAFSSISFEFWIVLHFEYITRQFGNSDEIIKHLKNKYQLEYKKNDKQIYIKIKNRLEKAITRAEKIREFHKKANPGKQPWNKNPYTDVDKLVLAVINLAKEIKNR